MSSQYGESTLDDMFNIPGVDNDASIGSISSEVLEQYCENPLGDPKGIEIVEEAEGLVKRLKEEGHKKKEEEKINKAVQKGLTDNEQKTEEKLIESVSTQNDIQSNNLKEEEHKNVEEKPLITTNEQIEKKSEVKKKNNTKINVVLSFIFFIVFFCFFTSFKIMIGLDTIFYPFN